MTVKLTEIIFTNALIKAGIEKGGSVINLMVGGQASVQPDSRGADAYDHPPIQEQWEFLQLSAAMYINSELPGVQNLAVRRRLYAGRNLR